MQINISNKEFIFTLKSRRTVGLLYTVNFIRMKKSLLLIFFCCAVRCDVCVAQAGEWAWMKGDSIPNSLGVFGTLGVPDLLNTPKSLYEPAEFKDAQGRFWLFGGVNNFFTSVYNTFWMYDKSTNEWTWEGGSTTANQPGVYGTKGVPSVNNHPGARGWGVLTWVDNNGLLWLFGGVAYDSQGDYGYINDLWNYNISTSEWTWVSGSNLCHQYGVYGTQGVPDTANHPGRRGETNATWVDDDNALWFFGGFDGIYSWNDLWRYNPSTNEWTWMNGSDTCCQSNSYGILGVSSPSNHPGPRWTYSKWRDSQNNFWLFGGYTNFGAVNDLWKYDPVTNEWTWMSGSPVVNDLGTYTAICDSSAVNFPKSRYENRACWTDYEGKFWLFGGRHWSYGEVYNDLWYYDPSTNEWTWSSGSSGFNDSGIYGTKGVPDINNQPASSIGSVGWIDDSCQLWMFGGFYLSGYYSNALWKYIPGCGSCKILPQTSFAASVTTICEKFCMEFFDQTNHNPTSWQWNFLGGDPSTSTDQNPTNICYNSPGMYDVTLITTNANGNDTLTLYNYITVYPTPPFPSITQVDYTLTSSPASSYQWQFNSTDIPGATNQSYTILQTGYYTVIVSDANGCVNSTTVYVLISDIEEAMGDGSILIYPNPSSGSFMVEWLNGLMAGEVSVEVVNTLGQIIFSSTEKISSTNRTKEIELHNAANGVYFLKIKSQNISLKKKIIIIN